VSWRGYRVSFIPAGYWNAAPPLPTQMRIAFDTSPLVRPYPPGVVRACAGLFEAMQQLPHVDLVALAPKPGENERRWRQVQLPTEAKRAGACGVHSPISAFATCGPGQRVSTVHELPWLNRCSENAGPGHRLWARLGVARANAVVCPTEFVRQQLIQDSAGGLHIHACHWGAERATTLDESTGIEYLRRHQLIDVPFCFAPGATRPKKNLQVLLRALASATAEPQLKSLHVVITGRRTAHLERDLSLAKALGLEQRVHALGYVEDSQQQVLSKAARFSVVLSPSEGFGFPVLESFAQGRPVLVTEHSAQAELAGAQGFTANPENLQSVATGLSMALNFDSGQSALLRERAHDFSWEQCALKVNDIWEGLH
jgi:glycosyltransferase involved in cell wall biosynthesis